MFFFKIACVIRSFTKIAPKIPVFALTYFNNVIGQFACNYQKNICRMGWGAGLTPTILKNLA